MAAKRAKNRKRLVLHDYDMYQDNYEKPRLVSVHPIKTHNFKLKNVSPLTGNQRLTFEAFESGAHLMLHGMAGTGKTFLSLYLALNELLNGLVGGVRLFARLAWWISGASAHLARLTWRAFIRLQVATAQRLYAWWFGYYWRWQRRYIARALWARRRMRKV